MEDYKFKFNEKMYLNKFHKSDISNSRFLVTGGAGFIGSNIVEYLLKYNAGHVRVLDNLSNGYFENIKDFIGLSNFEFIEGDIRSLDACKFALSDVEYVSHQAALGSVPRSISDPKLTNEVNIDGFLNMLISAKDSSTLKKMVYAASSSTYGDSKSLPKIEGQEGKPLSPYAVTKLANELYANVFSDIYGLHTIGLRYFNIFGPKQNPNNPYAAVIPIFCKKIINGEDIIINGDGLTSRDFTFVENAVQANIKAMLIESETSNNPKDVSLNSSAEFDEINLRKHHVFNVACGDQISLNDIVNTLVKISGKNVKVLYGPERKGDVKHSKASIGKIIKVLDYSPSVYFEEGLKIVYDWYQKSTF